MLFTGRNSFAKIEGKCSWFSPFFRIIYYPYVMLIGASFLSIVPRSRVPVMSAGGSRTLAIYFLHRLALYLISYSGFFEKTETLFGNNVSVCIMMFICGILMVLFFSLKFWSYPFNWIMKQKYGMIKAEPEK